MGEERKERFQPGRAKENEGTGELCSLSSPFLIFIHSKIQEKTSWTLTGAASIKSALLRTLQLVPWIFYPQHHRWLFLSTCPLLINHEDQNISMFYDWIFCLLYLWQWKSFCQIKQLLVEGVWWRGPVFLSDTCRRAEKYQI